MAKKTKTKAVSVKSVNVDAIGKLYPPIGTHCVGCGTEVSDFGANPCLSCNPANDKRAEAPTAYNRRAVVLRVGESLGEDLIPSPGSGSSTSSIPSNGDRYRAYLGELLDGGVVIDKRPCRDRDDWVRLVIGSPMTDVMTPPSAVKKCPTPDPFMAYASQGAFAGLALMKLADPDFRGLDFVSPIDSAASWQRVGARVGFRRGDVIEWSDGTTEKIPPFAERWSEPPQ